MKKIGSPMESIRFLSQTAHVRIVRITLWQAWVRTSWIRERLDAYFQQSRYQKWTSLHRDMCRYVFCAWSGQNITVHLHSHIWYKGRQVLAPIPGWKKTGQKIIWVHGQPKLFLRCLRYITNVDSRIGMYLVKRKSILGTFHRPAHISDISRSSVSV
jgi:hypothetical protein